MYVPAMYACILDPDDPDNYLDEAEDKETTDSERDDHDDVPVVDASRTV